jgi:hypothetical protein
MRKVSSQAFPACDLGENHLRSGTLALLCLLGQPRQLSGFKLLSIWSTQQLEQLRVVLLSGEIVILNTIQSQCNPLE